MRCKFSWFVLIRKTIRIGGTDALPSTSSLQLNQIGHNRHHDIGCKLGILDDIEWATAPVTYLWILTRKQLRVLGGKLPPCFAGLTSA